MSKLVSLTKSCASNKLIFSHLRTSTNDFPRNNIVFQKTPHANLQIENVRCMSAKKNFLSDLYENIKEEFNKNKEMKDNIQKFREEKAKLDNSDALKEARSKFKTLEEESGKGTKLFKEKLSEFKESEFAKKTSEFTSDMAKQTSETLSKTAETISKHSQNISQTEGFKKAAGGAKVIKDNIDEITKLSEVRIYKKPVTLRMRTEIDESTGEPKVYAENTDATGMVLHKDSKFAQMFNDFRENNKTINKLFEFKSQYDESDHLVIRSLRGITERVTSVFSGVFKSTEMSEVITEIVKMEPTFEMNTWLKRVQDDIIPNILEALAQGNNEVLRDWCTETAFNIMTHQTKQCEHLKLNYHNEVYDINGLDIVSCKMIESEPVLIVSFQAQQIIYITDAKGVVQQGSKDKIKKVHHVWALCRDQTIIDPNQAWRLMELAMHETEMFV